MTRRFGVLAAMLSLSIMSCTSSEQAASADAARAQALLEQKRIVEARLAIKEAIAERDDEPQYHLLRGRIEFEAGSIPGAFDAYNNARALDPSNMEALQAVSQLGLQTGRLRESLDATEVILSLAPNDTAALLTRGLHSVIGSRLDEADAFADRILAVDAANEGGAILKARVAARRGRPQEALASLERFGENKPVTIGVALTRLEIYRLMRDRAGLRTQFAALRTLAAGRTDIRIDEANFAFKDGRSAEALGLTTMLLADPKLPLDQISVVIDLWREYAPTGPADGLLNTVAAEGPLPARVAVAEYLVRQNRAAAARRMVAGASAADRAAIDAAIAAMARRWQDVPALAADALADDKTHCLALSALAEAQLATQKPAAALRSAQLAASECPTQIAAWQTAALAYADRDDAENAQRMWRQGMAANPQSAQMASLAANWLLAAGRDREAVAVGRRLTYDAPALVSGWRLYASICARTNSSCTSTAQAGLTDALTRFGIDLLPGQPPPNGLFGRLVIR